MDHLTAAAVPVACGSAWSLLVLSAFVVLAAAGAAGPIFVEASDNAAFQMRAATRSRRPPGSAAARNG